MVSFIFLHFLGKKTEGLIFIFGVLYLGNAIAGSLNSRFTFALPWNYCKF